MFNVDNGYLEGLCRGFKCGILKQADYLNLVQCETLEGKFHSQFQWPLPGARPLGHMTKSSTAISSSMCACVCL